MKLKKITFVILHFNTVDDTLECVCSIKEHVPSEQRSIIIVDNCSPNKSGKELKYIYKDDKDVHLILSDVNLGFARGNNLGFIYAKYELKSDFIVLMNNDTKLLHDDLSSLIESEYERSKCAVIGPKVITPNPPFDSNPGPEALPSLKHTYIHLIKMYIYLLLSYLYIDNWIHKHIGKHDERRKAAAYETKLNTRKENVQLHGCFWIFTPSYINSFDGLNNKTFLYFEEPLLFARVLKAKMKTVYLPEIEIYHKEDSATNSVNYGNDITRRRTLYKRHIASVKVLIDELYDK